MRISTYVIAGMLALTSMTASAEVKEETLFFGGAPSWAVKQMINPDGQALKATASWGEITLTQKASFTTNEYKAIKVYYMDYQPVGDKKAQLNFGVKCENYGNNVWDLTPGSYVPMGDDAEGVFEYVFEDKYAGLNIDKFGLALSAEGAKITIKKVTLVKTDDTEEEQTISWGGIDAAGCKNPTLIMSKWNEQQICTDADLTKATMNKGEVQKFVFEFDAPTEGEVKLMPHSQIMKNEKNEDYTEADYSLDIPVGSTSCEFTIDDSFFEKHPTWTSISQFGLQVFQETGDQTIKIKSAKRTIYTGDDATGIKDVKTGVANDGAYYTLQGVKLAKPQKGINIHNGKKVVIR